MASLTDAAETSLLALLFNNTAFAHVGDAAGLQPSSTAGSTRLSLATVAYVDADTTMTADEAAYTGYVRPTQARSGAGWTVANDTAENAALIQFGESSTGPETEVHVGLCFRGDTVDTLHLHQDLTGAGLTVNSGVNPQFAISALVWTAA